MDEATLIEKLVQLVRQKREISLKDAAGKLLVDEDTLVKVANNLSDHGMVRVEYQVFKGVMLKPGRVIVAENTFKPRVDEKTAQEKPAQEKPSKAQKEQTEDEKREYYRTLIQKFMQLVQDKKEVRPEDAAKTLGTDREAIERIVGRLKEQGIVRVEYTVLKGMVVKPGEKKFGVVGSKKADEGKQEETPKDAQRQQETIPKPVEEAKPEGKKIVEDKAAQETKREEGKAKPAEEKKADIKPKKTEVRKKFDQQDVEKLAQLVDGRESVRLDDAAKKLNLDKTAVAEVAGILEEQGKIVVERRLIGGAVFKKKAGAERRVVEPAVKMEAVKLRDESGKVSETRSVDKPLEEVKPQLKPAEEMSGGGRKPQEENLPEQSKDEPRGYDNKMLERFVQLVTDKRSVKPVEAAKAMKVDEETVLRIANKLNERGLIKIDYSIFGGTVFKPGGKVGKSQGKVTPFPAAGQEPLEEKLKPAEEKKPEVKPVNEVSEKKVEEKQKPKVVPSKVEKREEIKPVREEKTQETRKEEAKPMPGAEKKVLDEYDNALAENFVKIVKDAKEIRLEESVKTLGADKDAVIRLASMLAEHDIVKVNYTLVGEIVFTPGLNIDKTPSETGQDSEKEKRVVGSGDKTEEVDVIVDEIRRKILEKRYKKYGKPSD